jgi:hypothetical protein
MSNRYSMAYSSDLKRSLASALTSPANPNSHARALRLADKIERFWRRRGYHGVSTWIEDQTKGREVRELWVVRSNIVNGYPPKVAA